MNYSVIRHTISIETNAYVSDPPPTIKKAYQLAKAVPRSHDWPKDVALQFSDLQPEGKVLTDLIENPKGWLICSQRLARLFASSAGAAVELLPVSLLDHEGDVVSRDYVIVNVLCMRRAVDRHASKFTPSSANPDDVFEFQSLTVDRSELADSPPLFRLKEEYKTILVREDLAKAIEAAAMTGIRLVTPADFRE